LRGVLRTETQLERVENNLSFQANLKKYHRQNMMEEKQFFGDGRLRGQIAFASMCAECFLKNGEEAGWGKGQIYQRELDGQWLLVAGFPPEES